MFEDLLKERAGCRVLVIGDTIIDRETRGVALGLSAETPTIVMQEQETRTSLGGAALVARNLLALGACVEFITLVGDEALDFPGQAQDVTTYALREARPATVKHRFWVGDHKLLQVDRRDDRPASAETAAKVRKLLGMIPRCDAHVIADYRHGLMTPEVARHCLDAGRASGTPVCVASQCSNLPSNHAQYAGADVFVLNEHEADLVASGWSASLDRWGEGQDRGRAVLAALLAKRVVTTLGAGGCASDAWEEDCSIIPALPVEAVDTCGAGDAFLAALVFAGLERWPEALRFANAWAGLACTVPGPNPPTREMLEAL